MASVVLLDYRISEFTFANTIDDDAKVELKFGFSYGVKYADNEHRCIGTCTVNMADEDEPRASIKLTVQGIFEFPEEMTKEDVHKLTFTKLYPYVRVIISGFTANAGIEPIKLPDIDSSLFVVTHDEAND